MVETKFFFKEKKLRNNAQNMFKNLLIKPQKYTQYFTEN